MADYCIICGCAKKEGENCPLCSYYKPSWYKNTIGSHWEDCWKVHQECSLARIEELHQKNKELLEKSSKRVLSQREIRDIKTRMKLIDKEIKRFERTTIFS